MHSPTKIGMHVSKKEGREEKKEKRYVD